MRFLISFGKEAGRSSTPNNSHWAYKSAFFLWSPPGCKVLELCASTYLNGIYEGLAECLALQYRYLIFEGDNTFRSRINLEELERALEF